MRLVDLSHPISNEMATYPSDPNVAIVQEKDIDNNRTLLHLFTMGTHTGTHLDTPAHIFSDGKTLDDFSLSSFTGTAIKVDPISIGEIEKVDVKVDGIIFDSNWYRKFKDPEIYFGVDRPEIPKLLIEKSIKMNIKFFGCDLPSVDVSGSEHKPIHNSLLGANIIIYESLTKLNLLPLMAPFEFYGFPLPLKGLEGSPVRAIAVIE